MERRFWKNLFTFLLVLALTVVTVSALSTATAARAETAPARYSQEVRSSRAPAATELSAAVEEEKASPLLSIGAFLLALSIPAAGCCVYVRAQKGSAQKKGKRDAAGQGRRYVPRADMISRT